MSSNRNISEDKYEACPKSKFPYLRKNIERNIELQGIARNVA